MDKILVLDFGGQYNQLIARRVRSEHVYAEIKPYNKITPDEIKEIGYKGVIFTGGPNSVYDLSSPHYDKAILDLGIPVLGICYGDQLMAYMAGGEITSAENSSEYGKTTVFTEDNILFKDVPAESICWMSHTDYIKTAPQGFATIAHTDKCPCAAMCDESRKLYGVQFHPEVTHTDYGKQMLHNFIFEICKCSADWKMENFVETSIEKYKKELAGKKVLLALSGGVDSSVAAVLFAFAGCKNLKEIVLPASVKYIEERAFADCKALKKLVLPDGIESIGKEAFLRCAKLTNAGLKGSTKKGYSFEFPWQTEIPENAFSGMNKLQKVVLPETIVSIGKGAFKGCKALTEINLPENVKCDKKAFKDCTKLSI